MKQVLELAEDARVWIYQAERFLSDQEVSSILQTGRNFVDGWSSHDQKMEASIDVFHHRFVVIAADEQKAMASGCGIDKSVHFIKDLGASMKIDFFQRTQVIYRMNGEIMESPLHHFWASRKAGLIQDDAVLFDNTVKNVAGLKSQWETTFIKSWHAEMWQR
jgi:hypothetical protein